MISQIYPLPTLQPQLQKRKSSQEKQKDQVIDYYPPIPRYISSHEENAPIPAPEKEKKQKMRKLDISKLKNPMARKPTSSHPIPPAAGTTIHSTASTTVTILRQNMQMMGTTLPILCSTSSIPLTSRFRLVRKGLGWTHRKQKENQRKEEEAKQRQKIEQEKYQTGILQAPYMIHTLKRKFCPALLLNRKSN